MTVTVSSAGENWHWVNKNGSGQCVRRDVLDVYLKREGVEEIIFVGSITKERAKIFEKAGINVSWC
jgi:hypothetical protein